MADFKAIVPIPKGASPDDPALMDTATYGARKHARVTGWSHVTHRITHDAVVTDKDGERHLGSEFDLDFVVFTFHDVEMES